MEYLVGTARDALLSFCNIPVDMGAHTSSRITGSVQEVGVIDLCLAHGGNLKFGPPVRGALYNAAALREILETLRQGFAAVERLAHLRRVHARKLEEHMSADGKNRCAHLGRILV